MNATTMTKSGIAAAVFGAGSIFIGVFGFVGRCAVPNTPCPSPSPNTIFSFGGLIVLIFGVALLLRAGWRGRVAAWVLAGIAAAPGTWFVYEVVRQHGCPLIADAVAARACLAAYGEMTAPAITFGVSALVLLIGWLRLRRGAAPT
jgi:hypothetical protein